MDAEVRPLGDEASKPGWARPISAIIKCYDAADIEHARNVIRINKQGVEHLGRIYVGEVEPRSRAQQAGQHCVGKVAVEFDQALETSSFQVEQANIPVVAVL